MPGLQQQRRHVSERRFGGGAFGAGDDKIHVGQRVLLLSEGFPDASFYAAPVNRLSRRPTGDRDTEPRLTALVVAAIDGEHRAADRPVCFVRKDGFKLAGTVQTVSPAKADFVLTQKTVPPLSRQPNRHAGPKNGAVGRAPSRSGHETAAAFSAARLQDRLTGAGLHPRAETVRALALEIAGLECPLHYYMSLPRARFKTKGAKYSALPVESTAGTGWRDDSFFTRATPQEKREARAIKFPATSSG